MGDAHLGDFLTEVSNWRWDDFWVAERDNEHYTSNQAIIFALVRAAAMQDLAAIKVALNRIDGKLATPVRVIMPKVYYLYPNATNQKTPGRGESHGSFKHTLSTGSVDADIVTTTTTVVKSDKQDLPSMGLRETVKALGNEPKFLPKKIIELAQLTEEALRGQHEFPPEVPLVKSVIAAHLIEMGHARNMGAIYELFDSIDGKLVETLQVLGDDLYITSYADNAPPNAYLNDDGILQIEAEQSQATWAAKLGQ